MQVLEARVTGNITGSTGDTYGTNGTSQSPPQIPPNGVVSYKEAMQQLGVASGVLGILTGARILEVVGYKLVSFTKL